MSYMPGQVKCIYPYLGRSKLFVLGGPADGTEAQDLHAERPDIEIVGFEPCAQFYELQKPTFPGELHPVGLSDHEHLAQFSTNWRSSRVAEKGDCIVPMTTLDVAIDDTKQFALWIDIERSELAALHGCVGHFTAGRVEVVCLEAYDNNIDELTAFLRTCGMRRRETLNVRDLGGYNVFDVIYVKRF